MPSALAGLLAAVCAAAPPAAVVVGRHAGGARGSETQVADSLARHLSKAGVDVAVTPGEAARRLEAEGRDAGLCRGDPTCLGSVGDGLGVTLLFTVDVAVVLDELAVTIGAHDVSRRQCLDELALQGRPDQVERRLDHEVPAFARRVEQAYAAAHRASDAPLKVPPPPLAVAPGQPPRVSARRAPWLLGGGAALAAGATAYLTVSGLGARRRVDQLSAQGPVYPVTQREAQTWADDANLRLNLAIVSAAASLGLAALCALVAWPSDAEASR